MKKKRTLRKEGRNEKAKSIFKYVIYIDYDTNNYQLYIIA